MTAEMETVASNGFLLLALGALLGFVGGFVIGVRAGEYRKPMPDEASRLAQNVWGRK